MRTKSPLPFALPASRSVVPARTLGKVTLSAETPTGFDTPMRVEPRWGTSIHTPWPQGAPLVRRPWAVL